MSGDKNKPDLHEEERQEALAQNGALDAFTNMSRVLNPFGGPTLRGFHFGSTSFEGYELNDMIDIVESADPTLLDSAGEALVAARDAIKDAAGELGRNLGKIDWEGEAHTAFQDWAGSLVKTAEGIADYADVIGTQVLAAGSGLASVRKSMPPRDTRLDPKSVDDIPVVKRVEDNEEYTAAVKAEGHRQEAINQMYRLASFYTVSAGTMQAAQEPVFPKMPDVGVPEPPASFVPGPPRGEQGSPAALNDARPAYQDPPSAGAGPARAEERGPLLRQAEAPDGPSKQPVGMEINSVGTLPPQETAKPPTVAPSGTTGPAGQPAPVPPAAPGAVPPSYRGTPSRTAGPNGAPLGARVPPPVQGRGGSAGPAARIGAGPAGQGPVAPPPPMASRATGNMEGAGRTVSPGQAGSQGAGTTGRGIVGGMPRPSGPVPGPVGGVHRGPMGATAAGGSAAGRVGDGVVGGRPVMRPIPGATGSQPLRGTVIGGEGPPSPRGTGQRPGQQGVIGVPPSTPGAGQTSRRPVSHPQGVVGAPQSSTSGSRSNGRTAEGTGARTGVTDNANSRTGRSRRDRRRGGTSATD
ncbi:hypothetical protein ACIQCD_14280 [Streptomyces sp. NPDC093250]|uniref:WXG100 family type VII secretion target n=1 Tax=Streptomyces sp. NPDC093250 TaxID=3366036 RepID=UPI0038029021